MAAIVPVLLSTFANAAISALQPTDIEQARLNSLETTTSEYGDVIPYIVGNVRTAGKVIWAKPIREQKDTTPNRETPWFEESPTKSLLGSGGSGSLFGSLKTKGAGETTTYSYYGSWAVSFCLGEVTSLGRIWMNRKVVYDPAHERPNPSNMIFRFYPGSETQLPDPLIEANKGVDQTPAFRGLAYVVFEEVRLNEFGNSIPSVEVEIINNKDDDHTVTEILQFTPDIGYSFNSMAVDAPSGFFWLGKSSSDETANVVRTFNSIRGAEVKRSSISRQFIGEPWGGSNGKIYFSDGSSNSQPVRQYDAISGAEIASFGENSASLTMSETSFIATTASRSCTTVDGAYVICATPFGGLGVLKAKDMSYVYHEENNDGADVFTTTFGGLTVQFGTSGGMQTIRNYYAAWTPETGGGDTSFRVDMHAITEQASPLMPGTSEATDTTVGTMTITPSVYFPTGSGLVTVPWMLASQTDNTLLIAVNFNNNVYGLMKIDVEASEVVWASLVPFISGTDDGGMGQSNLSGNTLGHVGNGHIWRINVVTGEMVDDILNGSITAVRSQFFDSETNSVTWVQADGTEIYRYRWDQYSQNGMPVSDVVETILEASGLTALDYDLTQLTSTDLIRGYKVQQGDMRAALEPLARAYSFDGFESDYILKFRSRGDAPQRTLTDEDMTSVDGPEYFKETRAQDIDLPRRVTITFFDPARDFQTNTAQAVRLLNPVATVGSNNEPRLTVNASMDRDTAKQLAERLMFRSWAERDRYAFGLDWTHIDLDPTDVLTLQLSGDDDRIARLTNVDLGANLAISLNASQDQQSAYLSEAVAEGGDFLPPTAPREPATNLFILNSPLLRDEDDLGRTTSQGYAFAAGYGIGTWARASVLRSYDALSWAVMDRIISETTWGTVGAAIPDLPPNTVFQTDETTQIVLYPVVIGTTEFVSVNQIDILNGANPIVFLKANGEVEIMHYRTVVDNGNGSVTISGLLRGARGTDTMATGHTQGDQWILPNPSSGLIFTTPLEKIDAKQFFAGVGTGQGLREGDPEEMIWYGRDLMPWAPVNIKLTENAGDIDIVWNRRTRIAGPLQNGTGVVGLNEDSEAYEVDIYDGDDIIRTLQAATETATYAAADIVTDFGSVPATLKVAVYQMSAQVGRGFAYIQTLEVL